MRLRATCALDAIDLRDHLRKEGFVSFVDRDRYDVVHVAGTCDSYAEQTRLVTRAVGEWERSRASYVDVLDLRDSEGSAR